MVNSLEAIADALKLGNSAKICLRGIIGVCSQDWAALAPVANCLGFPVSQNTILHLISIIENLLQVSVCIAHRPSPCYVPMVFS